MKLINSQINKIYQLIYSSSRIHQNGFFVCLLLRVLFCWGFLGMLFIGCWLVICDGGLGVWGGGGGFVLVF